MSAATLRSEAPPSARAPSRSPGIAQPPPRPPTPPPTPLPRSRGAASLAFATGARGTVLRTLRQSGCSRVLFPRVAPGAPPEAVLLNTAGGLTDGDRLEATVTLDAAAAARVTSQAAERIYRSRGASARIETRLTVASGAWLEWLPQETILFDGSRLRRDNRASLESGARLLACESLVFGREAHGERLRDCHLHDAWRIRLDGRLVWADALRIEGPDQTCAELLLAHPAAADGARSLATLLLVAADAGRHLETARALIGDEVIGGASVMGPLLLVRLLGHDAMALRRVLVRLVGGLRAAAAGLPAEPPSVWAC